MMCLALLVFGTGQNGMVADYFPDDDSVAGRNNAFALDLYKALAGEDGNLFLSPHSISTAFAMAYAGARGRTAAQMSNALHFDPNQKTFHVAYRTHLAQVKKSARAEGCALHQANALWGQTNAGFLKPFLKTLKDDYGAPLRKVDFVLGSGAARKKINKWVSKETKKKIQNILAPGALDPTTRLVLANAVYFKGDWASKFEKEDTTDQPFIVAGGANVDVPMMRQKHTFNFMGNESLQILMLPYRGDAFSMFVLLPRTADGLPELESTLTVENLKHWLSQLQPHSVDVHLPKFEFERTFNLRDTLVGMGMTDAFDPTVADLSGMNGKRDKRDLFIQHVIHKAWVEVYEEGTKAAAATTITIGCGVAPHPPPATFRADHPFLFTIVEMRTRSILFIGRMTDPEE